VVVSENHYSPLLAALGLPRANLYLKLLLGNVSPRLLKSLRLLVKRIVFCILALLVSPLASADTRFLLVGESEQNSMAERVIDTFDVSGDDISVGLRASYKLNRYIAAELSYQDFGDVNRVIVDSANFTIDDQLTFRSVNLGIKGSLPVTDKVSVDARTGASFWEMEFRRLDTAFENQRFENEANDNNLYYGVGLTYDFSDRFSLGVEYTVIEAQGSFDRARAIPLRWRMRSVPLLLV